MFKGDRETRERRSVSSGMQIPKKKKNQWVALGTACLLPSAQTRSRSRRRE